MGQDDNTKVTAAEFVRHFSQFREAAAHQPIHITHHGRETHVLLDTRKYQELECASQEALRNSDGDRVGHLVFGLADWIDEALVICDGEMNVVFANRVALAITRKSAEEFVNRRLIDALPEIAGSLMEVHARRTMVGSEPSAADIPSPFHADAWLRFQSFPLGDRNVLKFRDITEDVQRHRLADVKSAIIEAMTVHGGVGYARLSLRGTIDRIDQPFCKLLDLPESRLNGVALVDLVSMKNRSSFRQALEKVLRGAGPRALQVNFLSNTGELIETHVAIVQLHGAYGAEGAVVLLTTEIAGESRIESAA